MSVNDFEKLRYIEARSPEKLRDALVAIEYPCSIMTGSWMKNGNLYGVWVKPDRELKSVKRREVERSKLKEAAEALKQTSTKTETFKEG